MGFDMTDEEYLRQKNRKMEEKKVMPIKNKVANKIEICGLISMVLSICFIVVSCISYGIVGIIVGIGGIFVSMALYGLAEIINILEDIRNKVK